MSHDPNNRDSQASQVQHIGDSGACPTKGDRSEVVQWEAPFLDGSAGSTTCSVPRWAVGKFKVNRETGCWEWTACLDNHGYGSVRINTVGFKAHRKMYETVRVARNLDPTQFVCHRCDVRKCVNPDHLWTGTAKDNTLDMITKGRHRRGYPGVDFLADRPEARPRGEKHGRCKLTELAVIECRLRFASGEKTQNISEEMGINLRTVRGIVYRRTWKHLEANP